MEHVKLLVTVIKEIDNIAERHFSIDYKVSLAKRFAYKDLSKLSSNIDLSIDTLNLLDSTLDNLLDKRNSDYKVFNKLRQCDKMLSVVEDILTMVESKSKDNYDLLRIGTQCSMRVASKLIFSNVRRVIRYSLDDYISYMNKELTRVKNKYNHYKRINK